MEFFGLFSLISTCSLTLNLVLDVFGFSSDSLANLAQLTPFIVSFNELAIAARKHFEVSDLVLVEGAIQEREVRQKHPMYCELCKQDVTPITEIDVIEIIASRVARVRLKNGQAGDVPDAEGLGNDYLN